jgi:hypothetical protein
MELSREWCRITAFDADGQMGASRVLGGYGAPDLAAVDDIAKDALAAARAGGRVVLSDVVPALQELLVLAGLTVEVDRKTEGREQPLRVEEVEEEGHLGDLPA